MKLPPGVTSHDWRKARLAVRRQRGGCWLCGRPIDYSLASPDPGSFEVDHKVAVNAGGPFLDPSNLAPSHRRCNRAKSDGPVNGTKLLPTSRRWF